MIGTVEVEQCFAAGGVQLGIGVDGGAESGDVGVAELLRDDEHVGFVGGDLVFADLVDLRRGQVGGGALLHAEGVVRVAIGQGPDAGVGAASGNVSGLEKSREALVRGIDLLGDGGEDFVVNAGLVGGGDGAGEFFEGLGEGTVFGFLREERVDLDEDFFEQIFRRHALVVDAGEHVVGDLAEGDGDFVEARDVVVVVLRGGEAEARDELRAAKDGGR